MFLQLRAQPARKPTARSRPTVLHLKVHQHGSAACRHHIPNHTFFKDAGGRVKKDGKRFEGHFSQNGNSAEACMKDNQQALAVRALVHRVLYEGTVPPP